MGNSTGSQMEPNSDANRPAAERHQAIAVRAYFRAQTRGFEPGHELDDWLAAEQETAAIEVSEPVVSPPRARRKASTRKVANAADRPAQQESSSGKAGRVSSSAPGKAKRGRSSN